MYSIIETTRIYVPGQVGVLVLRYLRPYGMSSFPIVTNLGAFPRISIIENICHHCKDDTLSFQMSRKVEPGVVSAR